MSCRGERTLSTRTPVPTHPAPRRGVNPRPRTWPPQRSPRCRAGAGRAGTCGRSVDHSATAFVWPSARNGLFPFSLFKVKTRPFRPFLPPNGARGGWRQVCSRGQWGGNRRGLARPPQACWELARRVPPRRRGLFGGDFGRRPDAAFSENSALCSEALCVWRGRVSPAGSEAPRSPHLLPLLPRRRSRSFSRSVRVCVGPCYHRMWKLISSLVKNNSTSPGTQIIPAISCLLH